MAARYPCAAFAEYPLQAGNNKTAGITGQHNPAAVVRQRERMTPVFADVGELIFKIGTPDIIGGHDSMQLPALRGLISRWFIFFNQTMEPQYVTHSAGSRNSSDVQIKQPLPDPGLETRVNIVLRVTATAICGSDLHLYRGKIPGTHHVLRN